MERRVFEVDEFASVKFRFRSYKKYYVIKFILTS